MSALPADMPAPVPGRRRHLALFIRSLAGGGGAERAMAQLAGGLAGRGHRVDLLLARAEGAFLRHVTGGVRVIDLGVRGATPVLPLLWRRPATASKLVPAIATGLPWVFGAAPRLADYLARERPDALVSALDYSNFTALLAAQASGAGTRTVAIEQNTLSARARGSRSWRWRRLPALARHFYPSASLCVGVSRGVSRDLSAVLGARPGEVATIHNPIVTCRTLDLAAQPIAHPWFRPGGPPVVLAAGKLKAQKDFPTLLEAFARLRAERAARLVILGRGSQRARLQRLAKKLRVADDVDWPGFVDNPFAYMSRASVFALSSAWEGLPSTLVEAMACGCPVVSTDCPSGPDEILAGGRLGRLVPVGDARALATALAETLDAPPARAALRARAAHFSLERAVDAYLAWLFCEEPGVARGGEDPFECVDPP